jgi:hypothetical protein
MALNVDVTKGANVVFVQLLLLLFTLLRNLASGDDGWVRLKCLEVCFRRAVAHQATVAKCSVGEIVSGNNTFANNKPAALSRISTLELLV